MRALAALTLAAAWALVSAASAHASDGAWERAWGKDVLNGGGTGFEVCTVAASCREGIANGLGGEIDSPSRIAADAAGNVYVADRDNDRVQKFDSQGNWERAWGKDVVSVGGTTGFELCANAAVGQPGATGGLGGEMNDPVGVAVDGVGDVYVVDSTTTGSSSSTRSATSIVPGARTW